MLCCSLRLAGAFAVSALAALVPGAQAAIVHSYDVGTGASTSTVQIDFSGGNGYLFTVHYQGSLTGWNALQLMAAETPGFTLQADAFPWGVLVTGLGIGTDFEYGNGDQWPIVENYWHYWTQDAAHAWAWSPEGVADRVLTDGSADAWVFGSGAAPQAVPCGPALALLAGLHHRTRRR